MASSPDLGDLLDRAYNDRGVVSQSRRSRRRSNTNNAPIPNDEDNTSLNALSPEYITKFIRRIKTLPLLFSQDHEHFRNAALKQQAWKEVGEEFGQTERWCQRKWVSLRDYFVKRKRRLRTPAGAALRPWIYYDELSFLNIIYGEDDPDYSYSSMGVDNSNQIDNSNQNNDQSLNYVNQEFKREQFDFDNDPNPTPIPFSRPDLVCQIMGRGQDGEQEEDEPEYEVEDDEVQEMYGYNYKPPLEVQLDDSSDAESYPRQNLHRRALPETSRASVSVQTKANSSTPNSNFSNISSNVLSSARKQVMVGGTTLSLVNRTPTPRTGILQSHLQKESYPSRKRPVPDSRSILRVPLPEQGSSSEDYNSSGQQFSPQQDSSSNSASTPISKRNKYSNYKINPQFDEDLQESDSQSGRGSEDASLISTSNPISHPYDLFCLSVSAQLKKMRRDKAMMLQIEIMNLIYQTEFSERNESNLD